MTNHASDRPNITALLQAASAGDKADRDRLFELVYDELRRMAHRRRVAQGSGGGLNTTALVHETYERFSRQEHFDYQNRAHFFATAARAMRQILLNHAQARQAQKRGGGRPDRSASDIEFADEAAVDEIVSLDSALRRLAERNPRQADVVECRFFGGLDVETTAAALDLSRRTVERDWRRARAWLYQDMT